jgi:hypothetical protein
MKRRIPTPRTCLALALALVAAAVSRASDEAAPGEQVVRFPYLRVNVAERRLEADGRVCLQRGLVEVLACTSYGKVHESVLVLDCKPEHLHAALLLLGMKESPGQVKELGDAGALAGERAIVTISWMDGGRRVERRAEECILDGHAGTTMEACGFVFTGSRFVRVGGVERFAATASGQMITTYHDPDAILDNPLAKGADDTVYFANSKALPLPGTPIVLGIRPATPTATAAPAADSPGR